jgi:hypothetical protein
MNHFAFTGCQTNPLKTFQLTDGARDRGDFLVDVKLHDFIACNFAGVRHFCAHLGCQSRAARCSTGARPEKFPVCGWAAGASCFIGRQSRPRCCVTSAADRSPNLFAQLLHSFRLDLVFAHCLHTMQACTVFAHYILPKVAHRITIYIDSIGFSLLIYGQ